MNFILWLIIGGVLGWIASLIIDAAKLKITPVILCAIRR
jgi:uncharacterized membrane protein YeaQ/YmgE (transglycosylase-associated protein family)